MAKTVGKDKSFTPRVRLATAPSAGIGGGRRGVAPQDTSPERLDSSAGTDGDYVDAIDDTDESALTPTNEQRALTRRDGGAVAVPEGQRDGLLGSLLANPFTRYFAESYLEMRKVTWPTPQDARNMTVVVVAMSAAVAMVLGAADFGLIRALGWVISLSTQK